MTDHIEVRADVLVAVIDRVLAERDALRAALDEIEALNAKLLADLAEARDPWEGGNVLDAWEAKCADVIALTRPTEIVDDAQISTFTERSTD